MCPTLGQAQSNLYHHNLSGEGLRLLTTNDMRYISYKKNSSFSNTVGSDSIANQMDENTNIVAAVEGIN